MAAGRSCLIPVAAVAVLAACAPAEEPALRLSGACMGTRWNATVVQPADGRLDRDEVARLIQAELDAVDAAMSTWKPDSDLSRLARARAGERVRVGALTSEVLALAEGVVESSGGAFDPTVGPLVELWGFGASGPSDASPSDAEIAEALELVGFDKLHVEGSEVWKDADGIAVDLSAIAKGHAVDRAASALRDRGLGDFLLEVGGEIVVAGAPPRGGPWLLGVENPRPGAAPGSAFSGRLAVTDRAVATSGDYRNFRVDEAGGAAVSHTIDPRTGRPVEHGLASVTVIAPTCAEADALATAVAVLGPDAGLALLERTEDVEGLLLVRTDEGLVERATTGLAAYRAD